MERSLDLKKQNTKKNVLDIMSNFTDNLLTSNKTIVFVASLTFVTVTLTMFRIPDEKMADTLKGMAQLNVTIAIGMGTLAIALNQKVDVYKFIKLIIVFMILSILCYFLSFWDYTLQRCYLWLSSVIGIAILTSTAGFIKKFFEVDVNNSQRHIK